MFEDVERRVLRALLGTAIVTVTACLIAWAAFVPQFVGCCRINTQDAAAIATLKNILSGQIQFRDCAAIDLNHNGIGEFGWFSELAAARPLRGSQPACLLKPPVLSQAFGKVEVGRIRRSGYVYEMWLPTASAGWLTEGAAGTVDASAAETNFLVYAWPDATSTAQRTFFIDATAEVRARSNEIRYSGSARPVPVDAALPSSDARQTYEDGSRLGRDGGTWIIVQ